MRKQPLAVVVGIVLGVLILCGALVWVFRQFSVPPRDLQQTTTASVAQVASEPRPVMQGRNHKASSTLREVSVWETNVQQKLPAAAAPASRAPMTAASPAQQSTSSVRARQAMTYLTQLASTSKSLTREQAAQINELFTQLVGEGAAAVPAIREFLQQNLDFGFDAMAGGNQVNYGTLRLGLIDTLQQIGGTEAVELSVSTLQTTSDPAEVALLSRYLEHQAPGQYRDVVLTAAREVLTQAASSHEPYGDMSPVFETIQAYGDTNIVSDLEKATKRWNYYATLALAGLPNGAGIPTLIKLAQDPAISAMGNGDFALRPLAQVAIQYPDAASTLVTVARQNQVPDTAWVMVSSALAGSYIQYGNQIFGSTSPPPDWSVAQVNQRIALVNQLLAVTPSPTGRQALQNALASLSNRLPK